MVFQIPPENPKDDIEGRNEDKSAEELKRVRTKLR